jgi:hypothetical protein
MWLPEYQMGRACPREGESPSSLFAPSGDFTDFNGLRKIAMTSKEEMPGSETTVASVPGDNAIFDEERGVAEAAPCVSQVRRTTRGGKTVEWSGCVPALTDFPQQIEQLELREAERAITSLQKSNGRLSSSSV